MTQIKQDPVDFDGDDDLRSIAGSTWTLDTNGGADENAKLNEAIFKIVLLESNNKILEGKLENMELKAQIAKNELEKTIQQTVQQQFEDFRKEMTIQQKAEFANILKDVEEKTNMELSHKMEHFEMESVKILAILEEKQQINLARELATVKEKHRNEIAGLEAKNQLEHEAFGAKLKEMEQKLESISMANQQKAREFAAEIANLEECLKKSKTDQSKTQILWNQLATSKELVNPRGNGWNGTKTRATISPAENGLIATASNAKTYYYVFALEGFDICEETCRRGHFPGTILYYFEVTQLSSNGCFYIGLSDGAIGDGALICETANCYAFGNGRDHCWLSGKEHQFEWANGGGEITRPKWSGQGNVLGCGLLLSPQNKWTIFFTLNGILMGKQISIRPSAAVDRLFPTIKLCCASLEANFGDNLAKPFGYDIHKCPGLLVC